MDEGPERDTQARSPSDLWVLLVSSTPLVVAGVEAMFGAQSGSVNVRVTTVPLSSRPVMRTGVQVVLYDTVAGLLLDGHALRRWVGSGVPVVILTRDEHGRDVLTSRHPSCCGVAVTAGRAELVAQLTAAVAKSKTPPAMGQRARHVITEAQLTDREVEVLARIASGASNQEVAENLFLSINTVKMHIRSAYSKIGVVRRSQAVLWCLEHNVPRVEPDSRDTPTGR